MQRTQWAGTWAPERGFRKSQSRRQEGHEKWMAPEHHCDRLFQWVVMGHLQDKRPGIYNCAGDWVSHHSLCLLDLREMSFTRVPWEHIMSRNITALFLPPPFSPSCPRSFHTYTHALIFTQHILWICSVIEHFIVRAILSEMSHRNPTELGKLGRGRTA